MKHKLLLGKAEFQTILLFVLIFCNLTGNAQKVIQKTSANERLMWFNENQELSQKSIFKNLSWQFVGPTNISGRMTDVEVVTPKGRNYTIYVAGASGGIWKTENEGI